MLVFSASASANPLNNRKEKSDNLFTAAIETELEFVEETQSIFEKIKGLFAKKKNQTMNAFLIKHKPLSF